MDDLLLVLLAGAVVVGIFAYWYFAPVCPKCGASRSKRYQHQTKDGGPDRRFSNNPYLCSNCGHVGPAVRRSEFDQHVADILALKAQPQIRTSSWKQPTAPRQFNIPSSTVSCHGRSITGALFYTIDAEHDDSPFNPSTIISRLPIGTGANAKELNYWPTYYFMTPDQRAAYLDWLATGRHNTAVDLGYVFLYFYGLEWRALVDKQNRNEVVHDLLALYKTYGSNKSFHEYATNLLGAILHSNRASSMAPILKALSTHAPSHGGLSPLFLDAILWQHAGKQLPFEYCWEIARASGSFKKGVAIEREPEVFRTEFETAFRTRFPNGIDLLGGVVPVLVPYRWAMRGAPATYQVSTTGMLLGASGKKKDLALQAIWSDLHAMWDATTKAVGSRARTRTSSATLAKDGSRILDLVTVSSPGVPTSTSSSSEIIRPPSNGIDWFQSHSDDLGIVKSTLGEIYKAFFGGERTTVSSADQKSLLEKLGRWNLALEPDLRPSCPDAAASEGRRIFRLDNASKPSARCQQLRPLLDAVLAVASHRGAIDDHEVDEIIHQIDHKGSLSPAEIARLRHYGAWLIEEKKVDQKFAALVDMKLPKRAAQAVATVALNILLRDHQVTIDDEREVRRLYDVLKVPTDQLDAILTASPKGTGSIEIDWHAVAKLQTETQDVQMMLADSIAHEDSPPLEVPTMVGKTASTQIEIGIAPSIASSPPRSNTPSTLDSRAQAVVQALHGKNILSALDFKSLCASYGLMPSAAIDLINEWSDETLGDRLIDGDGPYQIAIHLLPEH